MCHHRTIFRRRFCRFFWIYGGNRQAISSNYVGDVWPGVAAAPTCGLPHARQTCRLEWDTRQQANQKRCDFVFTNKVDATQHRSLRSVRFNWLLRVEGEVKA
jgi:hypothetical protein